MEKIYRVWETTDESCIEIALCKDRFTAVISATVCANITRIECKNGETIERACVDDLTWVRFLKRMVGNYEYSIDEYTMFADDGGIYTFEIIML